MPEQCLPAAAQLELHPPGQDGLRGTKTVKMEEDSRFVHLQIISFL